MWAKTFAAIFGGGGLSASIAVNLQVILPLATDTKLLLGMLLGFPIWVSAMIWSYASENGWHAWRRCGGALLLSLGVNAAMLLG